MDNHGGSSRISLPKGGGAIRGIGETFQPKLFTGTGNFSVPIATSPGREDFGPKLTLQYSTGNGNGPFGLGWELSIPRIARKTEKGLPRYEDDDVFVLSGAEDLVPFLDDTGHVVRFDRAGFAITRYRPRTEGLFARIERWRAAPDDVHWRVTTKDNVTSIYGKQPGARIFDPENPRRIFQWLLEETFDAKGNHILYEYIKDDPKLRIREPFEENRTYAQAYIRRILYGNTPDGLAAGLTRTATDHADPLGTKERHYVFEVLFDYGDLSEPPAIPHDWPVQPEALAPESWPRRPDPFSTFRPGFELRTLRRCQRVLMLHHFEEGELEDAPLVKSTNFTYQEGEHSRLSLLSEVTVTGHRRNGDEYLSRSMPPVSFAYSQFKPQERRYQSVKARGDDLPPRSLGAPDFSLVDLYGDGLPDVLQTTGHAYYFWKNLGDGNIDRRNQQPVLPAGVTLADPRVALGDLGGDGLADLIVQTPEAAGFYEATSDGGWKPFRPFTHPSFDLADPDVRLVDLTGDGLSDVLVTRDRDFLWFQCLGEAGYAKGASVPRRHNMDECPDVFFSDPAGRVRLADMSGDGLSDIVLVHDGRIDYWPNLGYGHFGKRITMANAPRIGHGFDPKRLFLADLDGSGTSDLIYVDFTSVHFWLNQSGNSWSKGRIINGTPFTTDLTSLTFADFYGKGTTCLVWSYDYGQVSGGNYKVLDFCGGEKRPYLLTEMSNNLGATTRAQYASSTKFYLEDEKTGHRWVTNLPFPVQVLEKTEVIDHIGKTKLVTTYKYHHGYYDGREREFRGFGRVDRFDTEEFRTFSQHGLHDETASFDNGIEAFHVPTVMTRSWFHTGVYFDPNLRMDHHDLIQKYRGEYYSGDPDAFELLEQDFERADGSSGPGNAPQEAFRALRGAMLRSEVYALDGGRTADEPGVPYVVTENRHLVGELQPATGESHGVYLTTTRESLSYYYERKAADPRINHTLTLKVDDYGNVLRSVAVGYRRNEVAGEIPEEQRATHVTLTVARFKNCPDEKDWYRVGVPVETRVFELVAPPEPAIVEHRVQPFRFDEILNLVVGQQPTEAQEPTGGLLPPGAEAPAGDKTWPYEKWDWRTNEANAPLETRLRLIEHVRTLYRKDNLTALLPLGQVESLALPGESFKLAFSPDLLAQVFQRNGQALEPDPAIVLGGPGADRGGYHASQALKKAKLFPDTDHDYHWWLPAGRTFLSPDGTHTAAKERAYARQHFFLPHRYRDPFHTERVSTERFVTFDAYDLLILQTRDALGNTVDAANDYRLLQPWLVTDPNRNRTAAAFDVLGMVVATAVMGKEGEKLGDLLEGFNRDPPLQSLQNFIADPQDHAASLLGKATTRFVYDLERYQRAGQPPFAASLAREMHFQDAGGDETKIQLSFSYSDGFGREIQKKVQAEAGDAPRRKESMRLDTGDIRPGELVRDAKGELASTRTPHRWVGSGRTVFNNKGKPVRQYEPFFSATHLYEPEPEMTDTGVSRVLFYDPVERVVATLHANGTYEKVVFDPWKQESWDVNDTVCLDPETDEHVRSYTKKHVASLRAREEGWNTWYQTRADGSLGPEQKAAADQASAHKETPSVSHFDSLGRPFLTIADNGKDENGSDRKYPTRVELDIEGNQRSVTDALGRIVMRYDYDMLGNRIHQASMEAGERWMLGDVAGKPIRAWDSRGFVRRMTYDALRRPTGLYVTENGKERLAERSIYGEALGDSGNHRTRIHQVFDGAGILTNEGYDFKGNLLESRRDMLPARRLPDPARRRRGAYEQVVDWLQNPVADDGSFDTRTTYDALNRPLAVTSPDGSVYRPTFNEANLLDRVDVNLRGAGASTSFVTNIDYNAKGQRTLIRYGNDAQTTYEYDPLTFRLSQLKTTRPAGLNGLAPIFADPAVVQDLRYTYDPAGNIMRIEDAALNTVIHGGQTVEPVCEYSYDALYRLTEAKGREHIGQTAHDFNPQSRRDNLQSRRDFDFVGLAHPNDLQALRMYTERYKYDAVGNFDVVRHSADGGSWTRDYYYEEPSLIESGKRSNRLTRTRLGDGLNHVETYAYTDASDNDVHGCMTAINGMKLIWDFEDQLQQVDLGGGGTAYYVYDAAGQRVRKVVHWQNGTRQERIYLDGYEVYREYNSGGQSITLERETLHVMDDRQRIALVETQTIENGEAVAPPVPILRYQLGNLLGSVVVELAEDAGLISYEEYHPFGTPAFQARRSAAEVSLKRYRYTGMERDEETGLCYHGARYYSPWVGRWTSCDSVMSLNLYFYALCNPTGFGDSDGMSPEQSLMTGQYSTVGGDHVHQVASRTSEPGAKRTSATLYRESLSVSTESPSYLDQPGQKVESAINRAAWGKDYDNLPAGENGKVWLKSTGDSSVGKTAAATPSQWFEDVKSFYKHREAGVPRDDALKLVNESREQLRAAGATPQRIPQPPARAPKALKAGQTLSIEAEAKIAAGKALDKGGRAKQVLTKVASKVAANPKLAKAGVKIAKAGKQLAKAIPFAGIAAGGASAAYAASQGDRVGAALDAVGLVPVAGDLVDAARGGYAFGEAVGELLVDSDLAQSHGEIAMNAAKKIGLGETASMAVGGLVAAGSAVLQAAANLNPISWFH